MTENKRFRKVLGFIQDTTCEGGDVNGVMDLTEIEDMLNEQHEENEKLKLHLHLLERVVYMLDNEVARAMEDGFNVSEWYLNYLARGDVE